MASPFVPTAAATITPAAARRPVERMRIQPQAEKSAIWKTKGFRTALTRSLHEQVSQLYAVSVLVTVGHFADGRLLLYYCTCLSFASLTSVFVSTASCLV
jgi:hypothetical protein